MPRRKNTNKDIRFSASKPIEFESIYLIINYVQSQRKECLFVSSRHDSATIEHLLRDSEIDFSKSEIKNGIRYKLMPSPEKQSNEDMFIFDEELADEIIEDGQCF